MATTLDRRQNTIPREDGPVDGVFSWEGCGFYQTHIPKGCVKAQKEGKSLSKPGNPNKSWTVKSVLEWSTGYLERHEVEPPRLTAEMLLAEVLGCSRVDLYIRFEQPLEADELASYREYLKRRSKFEPTQYILGNQEFWSLTFEVDQRVLIPRPETECLIEECLNLFKQGEIPVDGPFLDLCTGSGAIACALAKEFPEAEIDAADISEDALEVATANVRSLGFQERVQLHQGNLFDALPPRQYAGILSNPPYIRTDEMEGLQQEVRLFEPHLALEAGADGLDFVKVIVEQAPEYMLPEGVLLIEIGASQGDAARALAAQTGHYQDIQIRQDYSKRDRILWCRMVPPKREEVS